MMLMPDMDHAAMAMSADKSAESRIRGIIDVWKIDTRGYSVP